MNFDFLKDCAAKKPELRYLYECCNEAEMLFLVSPKACVDGSRYALEYVVKNMYFKKIGDPAGIKLFYLLTDDRFEAYIGDERTLSVMHAIRIGGNLGAHPAHPLEPQKRVSKKDAVDVLENLHFLIGELCVNHGFADDYPEFIDPAKVFANKSKQASETTASKSANSQVKADHPPVDPEFASLLSERMRYVKFDVSKERDESENKKLFISASLREAGWPIVNVPNHTMPNSVTLNCMLESGDEVDYMMSGPDGRPLAIIDMSTMASSGPVAARKKLNELAQKIKDKLGYAPIAYYTDGYHIYCIDQLGYPARRVFCFHSVEELLVLKQRASLRKDISAPAIDDAITNRDYQKKAICAVCKAFKENRRSSLLVMATGTGKTRVSISLVDILMKANWVKNVLFLADRTSLVRQAHKNFNKLLPNVTTSIYTGGEAARDANARIIFSTYQTMIGLINDETREFGIGRFDLIIVDEAHRSIFRRYKEIFTYFDALMVGLTATPRDEENKSTYDVFSLPNGRPDFAYELQEAIEDKHLVGFEVMDRTLESDRRDYRYEDLTEEQKANFEDTFSDCFEVDEDGRLVQATNTDGASTRIINKGSIRTMLEDLMENGLKVNAGDTLGKSVIFAKSHKEAEVIVETFQESYPYLGSDFCKLIDSQVAESQSLIDLFGERDKLPQIAVSVDMLDTGIDVPDIVNLVFFKSVKAKIKFLQMIGRGTRLSPDLFGPSRDKQGFLIFDYYDNFRYFSTRNTWSTVGDTGKGIAGSSQSFLLNSKRLRILRQLQRFGATLDFEKAYAEELRSHFISESQSLCNDNVGVQSDMAFVNKYRTAENWDAISDSSAAEIEKHILPLFPPEKCHQKIKSYDMLILTVEAEYKQAEAEGKDPRTIRNGFRRVGDAISMRMEDLLKLKNIPQVVAKEELIAEMRDGDYLFDNLSLERAEYVRNELRDLMQYIPDRVEYYVVDLPDRLIEDGVGGSSVTAKTYEERARDYILQENDPALAKLSMLEELTQEEKEGLRGVFVGKLGTAADFAAWSGTTDEKGFLPFLRIQTGISDDAIRSKFGSFLNEEVLDEVQMEYMKQIVAFVRERGNIEFLDLQKHPFDEVSVVDLFADAESLSYVKQLINGFRNPVRW